MSFFLRSGFRVHVAHLALLAILLQSTPSALGYTPPAKLSLSEAPPGVHRDGLLDDAFQAVKAGWRQAWGASTDAAEYRALEIWHPVGRNFVVPEGAVAPSRPYRKRPATPLSPLRIGSFLQSR